MKQREMTAKKKHSRQGVGDRVFNAVAVGIVTLLTVIVIIPLLNVVAASFSSSTAVNAGKVLLWPIEFTLDNYRTVLKYNSVWLGYRNTILYTIAGTVISVTLS
ncbi:MAG: hypothetical protein J6C92_10550, partial [Bacteroidaceae bacterium]|nr:hypothetical protein [Bacteroidaceae bacterium]